ncbi:regulatory protein [Andreprevotia lacus DSM 23236]|jgi:regulatory protein|uniref:Regulatory protein RecX n=1 Tax=Andreprevotia lacus DSM 23236 TaxID=1121001 RepID=A0A1W1XCX6_9NEIS|nr:recombination regulator RecX [Andreprevotia lacus]SMC21747.1 regulatory protein [Andreprevotia lacus DSM 23236]
MSALRSKALQLLAKREYSRSELRRKLAARLDEDTPPETLDQLLDDFATRGWLSDSRFAEQWVRTRAARYGGNRLRAELRQRGVADTDISDALGEVEQDEFSRAQHVWQRKFASPPQDAAERARQLRFLAARGFSLDVIYRVVGGETPDMD